MSTDGTAVPPADGDDAAAATPSIASMLEKNPPPDALAPGWVMRRSRHKPSTCYYYNQDSGVSRWDPPRALATTAGAALLPRWTSSSMKLLQASQLGQRPSHFGSVCPHV